MASAVYSEPPRESPFFPSRLHILGHQHECVRWQSLVWFGGTFGGMNGCYLFHLQPQRWCIHRLHLVLLTELRLVIRIAAFLFILYSTLLSYPRRCPWPVP